MCVLLPGSCWFRLQNNDMLVLDRNILHRCGGTGNYRLYTKAGQKAQDNGYQPNSEKRFAAGELVAVAWSGERDKEKHTREPE